MKNVAPQAHLLAGFPIRGGASYPPPPRAGGVADPYGMLFIVGATCPCGTGGPLD